VIVGTFIFGFVRGVLACVVFALVAMRAVNDLLDE
jgi:hypothetical protein